LIRMDPATIPLTGPVPRSSRQYRVSVVRLISVAARTCSADVGTALPKAMASTVGMFMNSLTMSLTVSVVLVCSVQHAITLPVTLVLP